MTDIFMDALVDTARMIPLLLIIYIGVEYLEYKLEGKIKQKVKGARKAGPLLGAIFGCVPQCSFSVISTTLYTKRLITIGTLLAVYLSTSDEAIPIILAHPDKVGVIFPILLIKVVIAIIAGYSIDFILNKPQTIQVSQKKSPIQEHVESDKGCCGHHCEYEKPDIKEMIIHPIIHTLRVFFFIFITSLIINYIIFRVGENNLGRILLGHSIFQPVIVSLIGLIPNCAASVAITQVFLKGGISFGSAIAGLSTSAGLGLLILAKESSLKDFLKIVSLLLGISIFAGITIQYFYG